MGTGTSARSGEVHSGPIKESDSPPLSPLKHRATPPPHSPSPSLCTRSPSSPHTAPQLTMVVMQFVPKIWRWTPVVPHTTLQPLKTTAGSGRGMRSAFSRIFSRIFPHFSGRSLSVMFKRKHSSGIVLYPPPPLYKLRPCPSYSTCRDRIHLAPNLIQYKCSAAT